MTRGDEIATLAKCGIVKIPDGTQWPNPTDEITTTSMWRMSNAKDSVTNQDMDRVLRMARAYSQLITHPAFSLKTVQNKVSSIRRAIK